MITFQTETFSQMFQEWKDNLLMPHWEELALDKDKVKLSFDWSRYLAMEKEGCLHILTVRDDAKLVGYFVGFVFPHLHYVESGLMAHTDVYFLLKPYRKGYGAQMFAEVERTLKERGVVKAYLSTKVHSDNSQLFELMGWQLTDKVFTKLLK